MLQGVRRPHLFCEKRNEKIEISCWQRLSVGPLLTFDKMSRRRAPRNALQQADDELQAEIDRAEKAADAKYAAAEKRARDEAREEHERYLLQMKTWGSTLYLFPMLPALFGVLTICVVSVVLNTDYRQRDGQTCNSGVLNTYLLMSQILAYVFLFGYACMFIGTRVSCMGWSCNLHCSRLRSIVYFYAFIIVVGMGVNGFGAWAIAGSYDCANPEKTPYAYRVSQMVAAFFWGCFIVALIYVIWYRGKKEAEKRRLKKEQIAEEDAAWEAEEQERLAHAEAMQKANESGGGGGDWFAGNKDD